MNAYIEKVKQLFTQENPQNLQEFLKLTYFCYENRADPTGDIQHYTAEVEKQIDFLEFSQADKIYCAVNSLCTAYDYAAFTDGFRKGAGLILSLLGNRSASQ